MSRDPRWKTVAKRVLPMRTLYRLRESWARRRLISQRVSTDMIEQVKAQKEKSKALRDTYQHQPRLGVVVTSFNQLWNVEQLSSRLLGNPHVSEVVVCEDGSIDGSLQAWDERLIGPNHFLIRSNDLHEIRSLDRALRMSRAEICCIVQDDDQVPEDPDWARIALELFDRHPRLGVLGGFVAFDRPPAPPDADGQPNLSFLEHIRWRGDEFSFVPTVSVGPYYVRASCYAELGGFDVAFSKPGQAGVGFDEEFGLRAWSRGWQVGYLHQPFKPSTDGGYVAAGGTFMYGEASERSEHDRENKLMIARMYGPLHDTIAEAVERSNRSLL